MPVSLARHSRVAILVCFYIWRNENRNKKLCLGCWQQVDWLSTTVRSNLLPTQAWTVQDTTISCPTPPTQQTTPTTALRYLSNKRFSLALKNVFRVQNRRCQKQSANMQKKSATVLCGWSGRLEQSTTGHSFGAYIINVQKHAQDTSFLTFPLHWVTVSRVRAANIVRRPCSYFSHVTAPYKLSFDYYY